MQDALQNFRAIRVLTEFEKVQRCSDIEIAQVSNLCTIYLKHELSLPNPIDNFQ
jgi:hypothetical protein